MYKVFINDKPLILTNANSYEHFELNTMYVRFDSNVPLLLAIDKLKQDEKIKQLVVEHNNIKELWDTFKENYTFIEAAGGLVKNNEEDILFIYRRGRWDLPKGKIEKGESIRETALREVMEECGVKDLSIIKELPSTYHTYNLDNQDILKKIYWFEMFCASNSQLKPQIEEDITIVKWFSKDEIGNALEKTFGSIKEIII